MRRACLLKTLFATRFTHSLFTLVRVYSMAKIRAHEVQAPKLLMHAHVMARCIFTALITISNRIISIILDLLQNEIYGLCLHLNYETIVCKVKIIIVDADKKLKCKYIGKKVLLLCCSNVEFRYKLRSFNAQSTF